MDTSTLYTIGAALTGVAGTWALTKATAARAEKIAEAAHKRIDAHSERIARLEERSTHVGQTLDEIKDSLTALHKRLDELFSGRHS